MVVTAKHYRAHLTVAHHLVKLQRNAQTSHGILIKDAGLCAYHESILLGVADPVVVVAVLTATVGIDTFHGGMVGLYQVLMFAA